MRGAIRVLLAVVTVLASGSAQSAPLLRVVDYEPSWSPDGTRIAFISNRNGPMNLYVATIDGKTIVRLTSGPWEDDTPAWSPDGRRIAFTSDRDGGSEIYVMNVDGTGLRRLTTSPGADIHPAWSPDGRRIIFNSSRNSANLAEPDTFEIFVTDADAQNVRQLTKGGVKTYATFSPDGKQILFRASRGEISDLFVMDTETGKIRQLTDSPAFDGWPYWSPDGRHVVFATETGKGNDAEIKILDLPTLTASVLSRGPGRCTSPKWSPDGGSIVFSRSQGGEVRLEIAKVTSK
jgi:TolB protein